MGTDPSYSVQVRQDARDVTRIEIGLDSAPPDLEARLKRVCDLGRADLPSQASYDAEARRITISLLPSGPLTPLADRRLPLPQRSAASLAHALLAALEALHPVGLGAVCLDPRLIFVSDDIEQLLLIPAVWLEPPVAADGPRGPLATMLPPELARADVPLAQPAADIFAMGALLWYLLSGMHDRDGLFSEVHPEVPGAEQWDDLLDGCLRTNPARRYASLEELRVKLPRPVESSAGGAPRQADADKRSAWRPAYLAAGIAVVVLATAFVWWASRYGDAVLGFGGTVVRYADRSYDGARWSQVKTVSSVSRAAQGHFGPLYEVKGVDAHNFWIGDEAGRLFRVSDGHWEYVGQIDGADYPSIAPLDGDTAFVSGQNLRAAKNKFSAIGPNGVTGFDVSRVRNVQLTSINRDFVLIDSQDYWKRSAVYQWLGGKFSKLEPRKTTSAFLHSADNAPLADFPAGFIVASAVFEQGGETYGLWAKPARSVRPMIAAFEHGVWVTKEEIDAEFDMIMSDSLNDVWFGEEDGRVFVVVASDAGRVVVHRMGRGSVEQSIVNSGSASSMELIAVWGVSPDKYWVMDSNGTVWERAEQIWRTVVRGLYDEDVFFRDAWVTPEGSVYAVTKDELYRLN